MIEYNSDQQIYEFYCFKLSEKEISENSFYES